MIEVTVNPGQKKVAIPKGISILNILKQVGIMLSTPCGGQGTCGKCKVLICPHDTLPNSNEKKFLTKEEIKKGFRLACQTSLNQDTVITIPTYVKINENYPAVNGKIKSHLLNNDFKPTQQIKKIYIKMLPPTLQDQRSDWIRVKNELEKKTNNYNRKWKIPIDLLIEIPQILRENNFQITIVLFRNKIIAIEAGDTTDKIYGIAFDIGTTTIAGYLIDLISYKEIAIEASYNPQRIYGDDVISRIDFARENIRGVEKLQQKLISTLNQIISSLAIKAEIDYRKIYLTALVGNTCMHHFLWSLPTNNLAISPYIPVTTDALLNESADLPDYCLLQHSIVYTAPNISAYVGGDIIADLIDISAWKKTNNTLIVDLGTNGEIILTTVKNIWACSAAAGPAFEGARISSGMRADSGAIDRVKMTEQKIEYHVIGESKPLGICGSGIVDLIAELVKLKIINSSGRLLTRGECPKNISDAIKGKIKQEKESNQFLIVSAEDSATGKPIYLTQKDIREIQLAKGAVAAGIRILIEKADIKLEDIDEFMLAGAFGNVLNIDSALEIGIIPKISLEKICSIGNAAGQGAEKLLLSEELRDIAEDISKKVQYVELSSYPDFQNIFADCLFF